MTSKQNLVQLLLLSYYAHRTPKNIPRPPTQFFKPQTNRRTRKKNHPHFAPHVIDSYFLSVTIPVENHRAMFYFIFNCYCYCDMCAIPEWLPPQLRSLKITIEKDGNLLKNMFGSHFTACSVF